jgi:hypothetical protein
MNVRQSVRHLSGVTIVLFGLVSLVSPGIARGLATNDGAPAVAARTAASGSGAGGISAGFLYAVSCAPTGDCMLVGTLGNSGEPLAEEWDGANFTPLGVPLPSHADGAQFSGVSCPTATTCIAVGYAFYANTNGPLAELWNGSAWRVLPNPHTSGALVPSYASVSCTSESSCMVAGSLSNGMGQLLDPFAAWWDGSTWSTQTLPLPAGGGFPGFSAVSCAAPDSCVAVGTNPGFGPGSGTFAESWNGSVWTLMTTPNPPSTGLLNTGFTGVSCATTSNCIAVGSQVAGSWNGHRWTLLSIPEPKGSAELTAVSCTSASACVAVGQFDATGSSVPFSDTWNGSGWKLVPMANPSVVPNPYGFAGGDQATLNGVSCSSATVCVSAGQNSWYPDNNLTLVETLGGATWSFVFPSRITAGVATPDGGGYLLVDERGTVYSFGDAIWQGDLAGTTLDSPIVGIALDATTGGYWLLGADGGVFSFHARFYGCAAPLHLAAPAVGIEATPSGDGYRIVAADGGVFDFGHAPFYGSMGGKHLNQPVVGMAGDSATGGYWLVTADGGIFAFHARFYGSAGALHLRKPVVAIGSLASGAGYRMVAGDGGVFDYGAARYSGSLGGKTLPAPIVAVANQADNSGFWLPGTSGVVYPFGGAQALGNA